MKLFYSPGACSFAGHVALHEIGVPFDSEQVDLRTKLTASGEDFSSVTAKGYVPALQLDDGRILSENIAVLDYIAAQHPQLGLAGELGRTRLIEALAYISTEIHKSYKPFWHGAAEDAKRNASEYITKRMQYLAERVEGDYLFGDVPSVADFYLLVTMLWAERFGVQIPSRLQSVFDRLKARPSVQAALRDEGLL
jgi:glutathione S-transferase